MIVVLDLPAEIVQNELVWTNYTHYPIVHKILGAIKPWICEEKEAGTYPSEVRRPPSVYHPDSP